MQDTSITGRSRGRKVPATGNQWKYCKRISLLVVSSFVRSFVRLFVRPFVRLFVRSFSFVVGGGYGSFVCCLVVVGCCRLSLVLLLEFLAFVRSFDCEVVRSSLRGRSFECEIVRLSVRLFV